MKKKLLLVLVIATGVISFGHSQLNNLNISLSSNGGNGCNSGSGAYLGVALRPVSGTYTAVPAAEDFGVILRAPKSDFSLSDAVKILQVNSSLYGGTATTLMAPQEVADAGDPYLYFPIALNSAAGMNLSSLTVNNWSFAFTFSFNNPKTASQLNKVVIVDQINNATLSAFFGSTVFTYLNIGSTNQLTNAAFTLLVNPVTIATVTAGGPVTFCTGKNVLLKANTGAGYIYQWKKAGVNIAGATLANYTATLSGVYTVVITNAVGCSITSAATTVLVNPLPIATVTAGGPLTFCTGKNVLLKANAGAGYKYQWKKAGVNIIGDTLANYTATLSGVYTVVVTTAAGCSTTSAATTVVVNPLPIALVTPGGTVTFCTGKNVLLKANAGAGYKYQWKKAGVNIIGDTLANYTATLSGVYTVVVTTAAGCSTTSAATTVVVNPLPIALVTPGGTVTFCTGKNVLLKANAGAGYKYQWKKAGVNIIGDTLANYTATLSGVYTVVVTTAAGCSTTSAATTVVVNPLPIALVTPGGTVTFCTGKNVLLKANAGAGYKYQWKKAGVNIIGDTLANYTATLSGVYTVVVTTAAGCSTTSAATTVVVNPLPIALVTPGGTVTFCTGKNVLLKANAGAGYKYQWKKAGVNIIGDTLANYTATLSGVYTVVVTTAAGCSTTSAATTVVVNPLPIALVTPGGTVTFCTGKNVLLKANAGAGYKYQWKKAGVNIIGDTLANYTATLSGVYTVVVTTAAGCSTTSAATTVVVNPLPIALVTPGGTVTFCTGKNVLLKANAGAGYKYQWKKAGVNIIGDTLANYTATLSGVYTVVVTTAAGCSTTSAATTVVVNPLPIALVTPGGTVTFCTGKNVLLKANAGAGYKYQWKKAGVNIIGDTLANYTATLSGVYTVVVTTAAGCSTTSAATTVVVNPLPIATITPAGPLTITVGGNVLLNASAGVGNAYQWKKDGVNIIGAFSNTYAATVAGVYTVIITNSNSCQTTSQPVQVLVNPATIITKAAPSKRLVEEGQFNPEQFINLYPNPIYRDEYLNIEWSLPDADKGVQVNISDITGRRIESRLLKPSDKKLRIKGAGGIYIVEFRWGENERKIFRILKIE